MYEQIEQARTLIAARATMTPRVGLILGSGLGGLADELEQAVTLPYAEIPGFHEPKVVGHRGELAIGLLSGQPVAVLRGRFHFYEGYSMAEVTFPVRVLRALGCHTLLVTNAAGGLRPDWQVGDIMRIADHIFAPGMAGHSPLIGPNDDRLGSRFPPMVGAYDNELIPIAHAAADACGFSLREGVYLMVAGPSFESAAELRAYRAWGLMQSGCRPPLRWSSHAMLGCACLAFRSLPTSPSPMVLRPTMPRSWLLENRPSPVSPP